MLSVLYAGVLQGHKEEYFPEIIFLILQMKDLFRFWYVEILISRKVITNSLKRRFLLIDKKNSINSTTQWITHFLWQTV